MEEDKKEEEEEEGGGEGRNGEGGGGGEGRKGGGGGGRRRRGGAGVQVLGVADQSFSQRWSVQGGGCANAVLPHTPLGRTHSGQPDSLDRIAGRGRRRERNRKIKEDQEDSPILMLRVVFVCLFTCETHRVDV